MLGLLDGLDVERLQLDNRLHVSLERIKLPQPATTKSGLSNGEDPIVSMRMFEINQHTGKWNLYCIMKPDKCRDHDHT